MAKQKKQPKGTNYEPINKRVKDWPIAKLYQNKREFVQEVVNRTIATIYEKNFTSEKLESEIARTYYSEIQRMKRSPWRVDKPDEKDFWQSLKKDAKDIEGAASEEEKIEKYQEVIRIIVERYTNEISATFSPKVYHFAKRFLSFGFASLLNAFQARNLKAIFDHKIFIQDRLKLRGHIEEIRELAKKGTIVLVPTHHSNIDSILVGWSIHAIGLPAFIYGAGLNLYNSKIVGFFMNRLGAYKVDRRKKNPFYLETLKTFSTVSVEKECNSLFFPGGTRSRSGALEDSLKLGLLGSIFDAQRNNILTAQNSGEKEYQKIYVVPLTISYHFVLEAKSLIRQYLKKADKERYYLNRKDEFTSNRKVFDFIIQLLRKKSDTYLSFGKPMDLFGNDLNKDGVSVFNNQEVDIATYFESNGEIIKDNQRDTVYTKQLGELIAKRYKENNIVLSSHIVAYLAFEMLLRKFKVNDVYDLFDYADEELFISRSEFLENLAILRNQLFDLEKRGELICSDEIHLELEALLQHGVTNVGVFHNNKPLQFTKKGDVFCDDLELLFYYRNRMSGYDLKQFL